MNLILTHFCMRLYIIYILDLSASIYKNNTTKKSLLKKYTEPSTRNIDLILTDNTHHIRF